MRTLAENEGRVSDKNGNRRLSRRLVPDDIPREQESGRDDDLRRKQNHLRQDEPQDQAAA